MNWLNDAHTSSQDWIIWSENLHGELGLDLTFKQAA